MLISFCPGDNPAMQYHDQYCSLQLNALFESGPVLCMHCVCAGMLCTLHAYSTFHAVGLRALFVWQCMPHYRFVCLITIIKKLSGEYHFRGHFMRAQHLANIIQMRVDQSSNLISELSQLTTTKFALIHKICRVKALSFCTKYYLY